MTTNQTAARQQVRSPARDSDRPLRSDSSPPESGPVPIRRSITPPADNSQTYRYVNVNEFQPNVPGWQEFGTVTQWDRVANNALRLTNAAGYAVQVSFLSTRALRVQFRPTPNAQYQLDGGSYAVVNRALAPVNLTIQEIDRGGATLYVQTGELDVYIGLAPYGMAVYRNGQLITQDMYGTNLVFSNSAVACLRSAPGSENYYGLGEKAGAQLNKKYFTLTCFNYDNFTYQGSAEDGIIPQGNAGGPLNPSEPLYNSMPFLLAVNTQQDSSGQPAYAYGLFLDNVAQSYFNLGSNDYSDMSGKYYLGALFGDLDYYILVGEGSGSQAIRSVVSQYTALTGRPAMPPKYALGYHQGCYGYYDVSILLGAAQAYRLSQIPIDGLHIDVDFQNNYRTFTISPRKFPAPQAMFEILHQMGFKCSANITGIISANPLDEDGNTNTPYPARDAWVTVSPSSQITVKPGVIPPFIYDTRQGEAESPNLFIANEGYGDEDTSLYPFGYNPYPYPTPLYPQGQESLGTYGFYSDMGRPDVQQWWGQQYAYL
ncbi:MAG TPA: TIM-barrel domain-containing protein, partial [Polyangiaceae bacterium]|nr:TIM-barrel domain-containing protein [Polyangiaceae bacterium]